MVNLLDRAEVARKYYDSITNDNVLNGSTRYIFTDGERCIVVEINKIDDHETLFKCYRRNGETVVEAV